MDLSQLDATRGVGLIELKHELIKKPIAALRQFAQINQTLLADLPTDEYAVRMALRFNLAVEVIAELREEYENR